MTYRVQRIFAQAFCTLLVLLTFQPVAAAQPAAESAKPRLQIRPPGFSVSGEIQGRIDFWKLIFTRYGENHLVFHHREHPEIIYSVLDMEEFKQKFSGKELARRSNDAVDAEYERIQRLLRNLADGSVPSTPAERRLVHLFSLLPGSTSRNMREAANIEAIRYQKGVRELFREGVKRSGRYLPAMEFVFAQEGLPIEITRLPLVESSFNYTAYSSVGAAGIWQFMRPTGKRFMRIDSLIDERKDPIMSTRAAARYLGDAYSKLGSWPLAITSYNHGLSGVFRAVSATGSKDLGTIIRNYDGEAFGFASKNFYAEFMAALEVEQNYKHYFPDLEKEDPWHFDEVRIGRSISYRDFISLSGASTEDVENLNRALLPPITKGKASIPSGTILRVPRGRGRVLAANCSGEIIPIENSAAAVLALSKSRSAPSKSSSSKSVTAKPLPAGGTIATIKVAKKEPPEEKQILTVNDEPKKQGGVSYKVVPGDTIGKIAVAHGVGVQSLLSSNPGISPRKIKPGLVLKIPGSGNDEEDEEKPVVATARSEGSAKGKSTAVKSLSVETSAEQKTASKAAARKKSYKIRSGDTLYSISKKTGTTVQRLKELNPQLRKVLKPGQELALED